YAASVSNRSEGDAIFESIVIPPRANLVVAKRDTALVRVLKIRDRSFQTRQPSQEPRVSVLLGIEAVFLGILQHMQSPKHIWTLFQREILGS
ncbi:unnamed protein product, partial [Tilletia laevis]